MSYTLPLFPAIKKLGPLTSHGSSQLSVLHLPLEPFTARSEARYWLRIAISAYPIGIWRPRWGKGGVPVGILPCRVVRKNKHGVATRMWKNFEDMFIHFDRIHERDGRTDGHTYRQTDTAWRGRACIASRSKNTSKFLNT